ncbi:patched domain-containing protein 3-like [Centruroides vittatus]|uniref:patched domain-containing protein 3-like n=1 Tax=Centruroides vittatus TaxID=120091 RepID=UPI00350F613F
MNILWLSKTVSTRIGQLGRIIGRYPWYFVYFPLIISCLLFVGFIRIKTNDDIDFLITADRGKVFDAKQFIDRTFPTNYSKFEGILRFTKRPSSPIIYSVNKIEGNMLCREVLNEIRLLDIIAKDTVTYINGKAIRYSDVCVTEDGKCFENTIITMINNSENALDKILQLKYPIEIDPVTYAYRILCLNFGGVVTNDKDYIREAKAIRLIYLLDESDESKKHWNKEWRKALYNRIREYSFEHIKVFPDPFTLNEFQIKLISENVIPVISVAVVVISIFCMTTYMTNNWVKSKPWLGVAGVLSAGLAVSTSFGLLCACGIENVVWNISLPFIILATEVDDAFVVLACWRVTDCNDSVENRMEQTYSNAAVSITITSLTNFISYCIAMTSPFPGIRTFCVYAATCIFFSYFFQLTFFGGCLALSGYREEKGLHPFTWKRKFEAVEDCEEDKKDNEDCFMKFFRDRFSIFVFRPGVIVLIICLYFALLSMGIWGITCIKEGIDILKFNPTNYEITESFRVFYKYFTEYPFTVHVVINETLDYSDPKIQNSIHNFMQKFHAIENIAKHDYDFSWLKYFKEFQSHPISKFSLRGYDLSQKQDFIDSLRNVFLKFKGALQFTNDISFNQNYTDIVSSRFLFLAKNVSDSAMEIQFVNNLWKVAEEAPFSVVIHTLITPIVEQGVIIRDITFQLFWITSLLIFVVFVSLIPNLQCALIVSICVVSITVQTIGFMSLWEINLDIVSMICLILCLGFCVNYPTHMCYSFVTSLHSTTRKKLKDSFYHVGYPLIQGSISTGLVLSILAYYNIYIYNTFFKVVFLIVIETVFHVMCVIPIVISTVSLLTRRN